MKPAKLIMTMLAVLALAALTPLGAAAAPKETIIKVEGSGQVHKAPEIVELVVGVATPAPTADQAAQDNAKAMNKVLEAVKAKLGKDDKLQTVGYRLNAKTEWDPQTRTSKNMGYEAVNQVRLTSRDPKAVSRVLDAASAAGANQISGPSWRLADPGAARIEALALAYADAQAQAQGLAKAAGRKLGRLVKLDAAGDSGPRPMARMAMMDSAAKNTPMEPGEVEVSASVTCQFVLE